MIYYAAQGLTRNSDILLQSMKWSVSNNREGGGNPSEAPVSGKDLFQILEIEGKFLAIQGETYVDVANRAEKLLASFEVEGRTDIDVVPVLVPNKELDSSNLQEVWLKATPLMPLDKEGLLFVLFGKNTTKISSRVW